VPEVVLWDVFDGKTGMLGLIEGNEVLFMGFENTRLFFTSWARHNVIDNLEYHRVVEDIVPFPLSDFGLLRGYSRSNITLWVMVARPIDIERHIHHAIHHLFVSTLEHRVNLLSQFSFLCYKIDTHGKFPVTGCVILIVYLLVTNPFPCIYLLLTHLCLWTTNANCITSTKNNVYHHDEVIITRKTKTMSSFLMRSSSQHNGRQ
jgi:hypothetical protein